MWIIFSSLLITIIWFKSFRKKRDEYGNSNYYDPKEYRQLTEKERIEVKAYCRMLLEKDSENITGEVYPDLKEEVVAIKTYQQLLSDYDSGKIDYIEFQMKSNKLVEKINISELIN